ncbi:LacI family DNA-binding transcriptional regulator [Cellulomonas marina]|nr:LacI family DNA-binding transcriptional regulator [Cellulomonas marina]
MQDVARAAGVSVMTVSNVVNRRPGVRAETRERVLEAVGRLGYGVNLAARSLRQGRTNLIGLAVPEIDVPYFGLLAGLLVRRAAEHGYEVVVEQTGATREEELAALVSSRVRRYDGLVLSAVQLSDADSDLLHGDMPVVVLGERRYDRPVDHVTMANVEGSRDAVAHLIARGCRRVAVLGVSSTGPVDASSQRTQGYREALTAAGLPLDPALERPAAYTLEGGRQAVHRLLDEGVAVDGVFAHTDLLALGAVRGLADRGLRVPDDVRVVGFDDVPWAAHAVPSLTTVDPGHDEMVEATLRLLLGRIAGRRGRDEHERVVARHRLVERESTA